MKKQKFMACSIVIVLLFSLYACHSKKEGYESFVNYSDELISNTFTIENANKYLLEQGYSEDFIKNTGGETKKLLYQCNAKCEKLFQPITEGNIEGLTSNLTISDIPVDSGLELKILTYNWLWESNKSVETDEISFAWDNEGVHDYNEYLVLSGGSLFEIHGKGIYHPEMTAFPLGLEPTPPNETYGTFYMSTSIAFVSAGNHDMVQIIKGDGRDPLDGRSKITYSFSVDRGWCFRKYYAKDVEYNSDHIYLYGMYQMNPQCYYGSYSIAMIRFLNKDDINYSNTHVIEVSYTHNSDETVTIKGKFLD